MLHKYAYIRARKKSLRTTAILFSATGHVVIASIYNLLSSIAYYIFPFPSARTSDGCGSLVGGMIQTLILETAILFSVLSLCSIIFY